MYFAGKIKLKLSLPQGDRVLILLDKGSEILSIIFAGRVAGRGGCLSVTHDASPTNLTDKRTPGDVFFRGNVVGASGARAVAGDTLSAANGGGNGADGDGMRVR